jgi:hypothetical protein
VIDNVLGARAKLQDMSLQEQRRRRTLSYWGERLVRTAMAIPAYFVSRIVGVSVATIGSSVWGFPLRLLGIVADTPAVYSAGRAFKLW